MEIIEAIKEKFQIWYLTQRDKYLRKELAKIPSDNVDDYYFDNLTNQFVYKDSSLNVQIGWQNTLNVVKTQIESVNISIENLEAIIDDIAEINIDTTALTAIIANIATVNVNINNLQAIIADIANIETQNIAMNTAIANINTTIGTINTAITNIEGHQVDLDINIEVLKDLDIDINAYFQKPILLQGTLTISHEDLFVYEGVDYLFNRLTFTYYQLSGSGDNDIEINVKEYVYGAPLGTTLTIDTFVIKNSETSGMEIFEFSKPLSHFEVQIRNLSGTRVNTYNGNLFFSKKYTKSKIADIINSAGLALKSGIVITSADEDLTFLFGRGGIASPATDIMYLAHRDTLTTSSYALRQSSTGVTSINASSVATIYNRIGNVIKMALNTSLLTMSVPIAMSTNKITGLGNGVNAQDAMAFRQKTVASELNLADLNEKLHASLAEVSASQHHTKTVASELNLADLNEKLHASLAEVSASQHHTKTVASELNLADLNEKSYDSLTDKPSVPDIQLPAFPTSMITMTFDNTWQDVDISATYGAKKHLVFLHLYVNCSSNKNIYFNDNTADLTIYHRHQVANVQGRPFIQIHTDINGIWSYKGLDIASGAYCILAVLTP